MRPRKPTRRMLLQSAAGLAAGVPLSRCGNSPNEPESKGAQPERISDDPHSAVDLPGRGEPFEPNWAAPATRTDWTPENVIVLMLDSFRADHLGAFGDSKVRTPNLDRFAADAAFFTHAYPEGLPTIPARTSLFTGKFTYPFRGWQVLYPEDHSLLAEILWGEGFRTAFISDTYHMHKPSYGFSRGFDDVVWIRGQESDPYVRDPRVSVDIEPYFKPRGENDQAGAAQTRQYLLNRHDWKGEEDHFTPRVMGRALDWLKRRKEKENLFLWIDSFCPHEPWDPPDAYLKRVAPNYSGKRLLLPTPGDVEGYLTKQELANVVSLYGGVIAFVDHWVGRFLEELRRMDLYDNSLIIIATDHGEPFGEHGIVRKARPWPYEELARTFLMIRRPGAEPRRIDSYVQLTDITPTILEYCGVPPLERMTGKTLTPLLDGREERIRDAAVCCHYRGGLSIRHDEWSYHYYLPGKARQTEGSRLTKDGPELYHLRDDPGEQRNLIDAEPEKAQQLDRMLRDFTQRLIDHEMKHA